MIVIRPPESIYQAHGTIHKGTFQGRWHFSFDLFDDPEYTRFGALRVFNDYTLSPAVCPGGCHNLPPKMRSWSMPEMMLNSCWWRFWWRNYFRRII
jgi:hypothetical protein